MMKRLLFLMQMLIAFAAGVSAQEVVATFDFVANPWEHAQGFGSQGQDSYDQGNITEPLVAPDYAATLAFDNTGASTPARFWNSTGQVRVYSGTKATITAPTGKAISKIAVTATASNYLGTPEPFIADGSVATATLAEAVESYTFTANANARWTKIEVTLVPVTSGGGEDPAPSPTGSIEISKSNSASTGFPISAGADAASQKAQFIYPASMLTDLVGKEITEIKLHLSDAGSIQSSGATEVINLAEVDATAFSSAAFLTADFTNVYNATAQTVNGSKEWVFTLSSPYVYEGGNLLVQMETNNPSGMLGSPNFYGTTQSGNVGYISYTEFGYSESKLSKYLPMMTVTYQEAVTPDPEDPSEPTVATFDIVANPWNHPVSDSVDKNRGNFDGTENFLADDGATSMTFTQGSGTTTCIYNSAGNHLRLYPGSTAIITAPAGKLISKVDLEWSGSNSGSLDASTTLAEPSATYTLTPTTNARLTKITVTLVPGSTPGGGDEGGYVIPEGYHETTDWTDSFEKVPNTISSTALWPGWGYTSSGTATTGFFSGQNKTKHSGSYGIYLGDKRSASNIDYLVTPALKGDVKMWIRAYSTYTAGAYYMRFYEVTENEDGTFVLGDLVKEITPESTTYAQYDIASLSDYARLAVTGSYVYFDDITASYAVVPDDPGMQVTAITGEWTDNNPLYASMEGKATYSGTFKVKNSGDVPLVAGRENYSVTITSQSTSYITIPETIIPMVFDLAVGEESAEIPFSVECTLVNPAADGRTAIRVTSNLLENGKTATTSTSYQQTSWFTLKTVAPQLEVRNSSSFKMADNTTELGLVDAPASTTLQFRSIGGSPVVLKNIVTTCPGITFAVDGEALTFPYTIEKNVEQNFTMTFNNAGGQSTTLDFVYGNNYNDEEYHYVTKAVSAVVKDASLYFEDFDGYLTVPEGWCQPGWVNEDGSNWKFNSMSSNTYATNGTQAYPEAKLISPKITFAEGQALTISATPNGNSTYTTNDYYIKVWYSADRQNWTLANVIAKSSTYSYTSVKDVPAEKIIVWPNLAKSYSIVASDFDPIVITGIPAGDWYIGFQAGYSSIDYIFGGQLTPVTNDLYINSYDVEANPAMVNYPVKATVKYTNMVETAAAPRTVALYDGETLIEEKAGAELEGFASEIVEFTFTPHAAGEMNLKVKIANTGDDYSVETLAKALTIAEEAMNGDVTVGEKTTSQTSPLGINYKKYRGEWIWTADKIGLDAGAVITSVTLKYKNTSMNMVKKVKVYLMSTEEDAVYGSKFTPVAELTPNYSNDEFAMNKNETDLVFNLSVPYTYDGKNIRVVFDFDGTDYTSTPFDCYSGKSYYYRSDGLAATDASSVTQSSYIPVGILGVAVTAPVLSGTITEAGDALAGATVEAKSGDVVYTATTDADGNYSMEIMQPELEYVVTVSAAAHKDVSSEAATIAEDKTFDYNFTSAFVKINPAIKYSTFYDSEHAVKIPEGVTPYVFGLSLTANEMALVSYADYLEENGETYENVVQAGEAVVLMGSGDVALEYTTSSLPLIEYNWLSGFDSAATTTVSAYWSYMDYTDADCYFYALSLNKDKDPESVGFYWMNETGAPFMSAAHKAYLSIPADAFSYYGGAAGYAKSAIQFKDGATAIKNVNVERNGNQMYNMAGQRVNENAKGIVIKNGKKFMVK